MAMVMGFLSVYSNRGYLDYIPLENRKEHLLPEPDCAGLTFTVVSGSVLWELESTSIVDVISGIVVSAIDVDIVTVVVGS